MINTQKIINNIIGKDKLLKQSNILSFRSVKDLEEFLLNDSEIIPVSEKIIIILNNEKYYLIIENWDDGCMESRGYEKTKRSSIKRIYLNIMMNETRLKPDMHGYLPESNRGEYGISYIMQKIKK